VLTYPDAKKVSYAYDALNRMISVTDWAGRLTRYEYDANSNLTRSVRPNGSIITYSYNTAGQLIQQKDVTATGVLIAQYDFTYDAAGNIVEEKVSPAPEPFVMQPVNMTYTSANRVATYNGKPVTYDADGNMTSMWINSARTISYQFDSRNRLNTVVAGIYLYYTYDAENNRIKFNQDGELEDRYVVNPEAPLSQVLIKSRQRPWYEDRSKIYYVYGLGLIGTEDEGGDYVNYHYDLRGSTIASTNQQGEKVSGLTVAPQCSYNGCDSRDGVILDTSADAYYYELYYMRARYYNPAMRRFINQDVLRGNIGNGQSLNRYAYVNGNPVSYVDPLGLAPMTKLRNIKMGYDKFNKYYPWGDRLSSTMDILFNSGNITCDMSMLAIEEAGGYLGGQIGSKAGFYAGLGAPYLMVGLYIAGDVMGDYVGKELTKTFITDPLRKKCVNDETNSLSYKIKQTADTVIWNALNNPTPDITKWRYNIGSYIWQ